MDPGQPLLQGSAAEPEAAQQPDQEAQPGDLYGTAVRANAAARPLMLYRTKRADASGSALAVSRTASYIVTGALALPAAGQKRQERARMAHAGVRVRALCTCLPGAATDMRVGSECRCLTPMHAGGTAGLGLLAASHLAGSGACALLLLGRSGRAARAADMAAVSAASARTQVTLMRADVTELSESRAAVGAARRSAGACLGGVMHAAGQQVRACSGLTPPSQCGPRPSLRGALQLRQACMHACMQIFSLPQQCHRHNWTYCAPNRISVS